MEYVSMKYVIKRMIKYIWLAVVVALFFMVG